MINTEPKPYDQMIGDDVINDKGEDDVIATDEEYSHKKFAEMFTVVGDDSDEFPIWAEEAIWEDHQNYDEEEFLTGWGHF